MVVNKNSYEILKIRKKSVDIRKNLVYNAFIQGFTKLVF